MERTLCSISISTLQKKVLLGVEIFADLWVAGDACHEDVHQVM